MILPWHWGCALSEMQGRKELGHLAFGFLDPVGPHPVVSIPFHLWHLCVTSSSDPFQVPPYSIWG